jgi:eukaryotic-like serine/threonine-protein kinase
MSVKCRLPRSRRASSWTRAAAVSALLGLAMSLSPDSGAASTLPAAVGHPSSPGAPTSASWPQFRFGPAHDGFNWQESTLGTANAPRLARIWSTTGDYTDPVIAGGLDFSAGWPIPGNPQVTLFARNAKTGALIWSAPYQTNQPIDPAAGQRLIHVVADAGLPRLLTFAIADGKPGWSIPLVPGGVYSAPTIAGGMMFLTSRGGQVLCLNPATGAQIWSITLPAPVISAAPIDLNGMLYVDGKDQRVYAIGALHGHRHWTSTKLFAGGGHGAVGASLAAVKGRIFLGASNDKLYALNANTGKLEWKFGAKVASGNLSFAVAYHSVYVTGFANGPHGENPVLYSLDGATGKKRWQFVTDNANNPAVANGVVYLTNRDGMVFALDATTGKKLWSYKSLLAGEFSYPAIAGGMVYINSYGFGLPPA